MSKCGNTFLEYLKNGRLADEIYNEVFNFCNHHKSLLLEKCDGYDVYRIIDVNDIDLDYKQVWIDDTPGTTIEFDIAIEVDAEVEGVSGKHHDHDSYSSRFWVLVSCKGDLAKSLSGFRIIGIWEFNTRSKPKKPLSGDMVPIMRSEDYESYANEILKKYYPEALEKGANVDVYELAKRMGFIIKETNISKDRIIFGQFFFNTAKTKLIGDDGNEYEVTIEKNTILVDTNAAYLYSYGCKKLTIAHELVHGYFHRKAFLFAQLFDKDLRYIGCKIDGGTQGLDTTPVCWMERQANGVAPFILMPKEGFEAYARKMIKNYLDCYKVDYIDILPLIVNEIANHYSITIYSAKKRLIDIGIWEASGVLNWVDEGYARPFKFGKGSLASDETFTISVKDFNLKMLMGRDLVSDAFLGRYEFVENHVVLNDPAYIEKDKNGSVRLTEYARMHLDKCALKFKCRQLGSNYDNNLGAICYLCRDISKCVEFDLSIVKNPNIVFSDEGKKKDEKYQESVNEIYKAIAGMQFGEIVKFLMKYLDINEEELSYDADVDTRTIRRYINGENKEKNRKTTVAIIRAFNVPPKISSLMLQKAGINLVEGNVIDDALSEVLLCFRESSAEDVNRFFRQKTGETLTKEKL